MFAQQNYPEIQGMVNPLTGAPPIYKISQIGCFITSFANLLTKKGSTADPGAINAFLRDRGLYIDIDDGRYDDVSWDTITKIDPSVTVSGMGTDTPPNNNSIVKFIYNNGASTHFCLVNNIANGTIIDSWDSQVKSWDVYGGVKAWASYNISVNGGDSMNLSEDAFYQIFRGMLGRDPTPQEASTMTRDPNLLAATLWSNGGQARFNQKPDAIQGAVNQVKSILSPF